ncbi:MAG: BREX system ATP-binding domain-containing protein [Sphaerochaeta sp.]|jgi:hypothetical protein|nr:DUF2791 family P-loop domain-containing protein [Spirochaetales bacterium]
MHASHTLQATIAQLSQGEVPDSEELLSQLSVGIEFLTDFWREQYLAQYIKEGGSAIKFVTGRAGSGKSHTLKLLRSIGRAEGYVTVNISARDVWLHDFREFYLEILRRANIKALLADCAKAIILDMGYDPTQIKRGTTFLDYLAEIGHADGLTRWEIRSQLRQRFLNNTAMDNNFSLACSLLCGSMLGHPTVEEANEELLYAWLHGEKQIRMTQLRPLGLAPSKVTKYNARNLLRSLASLVVAGGHSGLLITVDNLEVLVDSSGMNPLHYTKMRREDTYESIRQLIDDIDTFSHTMVVFSFERSLLDNENRGLKSYQALWMRIQNEVVSERINKFSDVIDLDRIASQIYTPAMLIQMSEKLAQVVGRIDVQAKVFDEETAYKLIAQAKSGSISLPRLVNRMTLGFLTEEEASDEL